MGVSDNLSAIEGIAADRPKIQWAFSGDLTWKEAEELAESIADVYNIKPELIIIKEQQDE